MPDTPDIRHRGPSRTYPGSGVPRNPLSGLGRPEEDFGEELGNKLGVFRRV